MGSNKTRPKRNSDARREYGRKSFSVRHVGCEEQEEIGTGGGWDKD